MAKNQKLYICNVADPVDHCRHNCRCGIGAHHPDDCTKPEYCGVVDAITKCRPLTKKEMKMLEGENHVA